MASRSRGWSLSYIWRGDEETALKKDDDHKLPRHARQSGQWQAAPGGGPRRRVVLRLAIYAFAFFIVVYGLYNTLSRSPKPSLDALDDLRRIAKTPPRYDPPRLAAEPPSIEKTKPDPEKDNGHIENKGKDKVQDKNKVEVKEKEKIEAEAEAEAPQTYHGPLRLPQLGASLQSILETGGQMENNRNVLFAAASLQSASLLLPMACQMAAERTNYVHFAFMSRSDVPMQELLKINGIDESCPLIAHDARPDHPIASAESRMALASARAMYHIAFFMHPQAIIIDASTSEEDYFLSGLRDQIKTLESPLIELPEGWIKKFSWLTKLDASALAAWNKVHFDILVHAPPSGAGNLKRLLESLAHADLVGVTAPHITVELPSIIDQHLESFLAEYQWPPRLIGGLSRPDMFSLRHRIPRKKMDEEESSVRFLESFWPNNPSYSHVLVLSPHTEVSPQFFHCKKIPEAEPPIRLAVMTLIIKDVKYSLLQRRYSAISLQKNWPTRMFGISFTSPTTLLDDVKPLPPPAPLDGEEIKNEGTSFLWQAPNSDAILILGEKWVELHGYISQLLEKQHAESTTPEILTKKDVSKKHPAWLEFALQLSRLRGYFTLYPSQETAGAILGVHGDLRSIPEEYEGQTTGQNAADIAAKYAMERFDSGSQVDMLETLPHNGELTSIHKLPRLTWDGQSTNEETVNLDAAKYRREFRRQVGQCVDEKSTGWQIADRHAKDLFCSKKAG